MRFFLCILLPKGHLKHYTNQSKTCHKHSKKKYIFPKQMNVRNKVNKTYSTKSDFTDIEVRITKLSILQWIIDSSTNKRFDRRKPSSPPP
jgi:hypothetical protein